MAEQDEKTSLVPTVTGVFEFDKRDLVSVAVARAERKIRGAIKVGIEALGKAEKAFHEKKGELNKLNDIMPDKVKKLIANYKKHISPLVAGKDDFEWTGTILSNYANGVQQNKYLVTIRNETKGDGRSTNNFPPIFDPLTKAQKLTLKQIEAIDKEIQTAENDLIDAKRKLNDMPTFERQVKAAVVEAQLKDSKAGQKLLDAMEKNFDDTLKLLG